MAVASVQSDEAEGDGSVVVVDPENQRHVQGLVWGGMYVRWRVEVQNLLPLVQAGAYLGVRWLVVEAREDLVGGGRGRVVEEVCKVQEVADGRGVQEAASGHGVQDRVEVLGPWGLVSPLLEMLGRIQGPEKDR